ncbi:unnamed protein product, partial [Mesorhabditis belari]|uniref:G-protein coupled receptors family 1 profile domain-containing protein n=1 Tax=Mesorhabditis belari TaxID=2138241 RepID=A0AAF3ELG8_9BILA
MKARRSVQQMVVIAWIVSFVTSAPQVYFLPLLVTVVCYSLILWRISHKTCFKSETEKGGLLRRNGGDNLQRARSRTLRMTFVVVFAFLFCWTPYAIIMFLHSQQTARFNQIFRIRNSSRIRKRSQSATNISKEPSLSTS